MQRKNILSLLLDFKITISGGIKVTYTIHITMIIEKMLNFFQVLLILNKHINTLVSTKYFC